MIEQILLIVCVAMFIISFFTVLIIESRITSEIYDKCGKDFFENNRFSFFWPSMKSAIIAFIPVINLIEMINLLYCRKKIVRMIELEYLDSFNKNEETQLILQQR